MKTVDPMAVRRAIARVLNVPVEKVTPGANITGDLGGDSLDVIECVMEAEKVAGVDLPDEYAHEYTTVGGIIHRLKVEAALASGGTQGGPRDG